jgi:alanyl-tRNA synthetase
VPNDPTLLFTNAGMVQFKDKFLGLESTDSAGQFNFDAATSSQLCVRAGGKHNDLSNVGFTRRHHTLFEMLGNFSFGRYFKEEAILLAWTYLVKEVGVPAAKLSVSVHHTDPESAAIWAKVTGWSSNEQQHKIRVLGDADNFWSMGDSGPCGPCTEIFWDQEEEVDGDRFLEIWNLVFMQFDRQQGQLTPLATPCVDTGMGLERLASVVQGVESNFCTDDFQAVLSRVYDAVLSQSERADELRRTLPLSEVSLSTQHDAVGMRVIADHLRAAAFLINDGVVPSGNGRGYVLRRILRRAVTFRYQLGVSTPILGAVLPAFLDTMKHTYPTLLERQDTIKRVLETEELAAQGVMERGSRILESTFTKMTASETATTTLPGDVVFDLYHSVGFPLDITEMLSAARGYTVDIEDFDARMTEAKDLSRKSWVGSGDSSADAFVQKWQRAGHVSSFEDGYAGTSEVVCLHVNAADQTASVILDKSSFYPTGGGQVGDTGVLVFDTDGETTSFQVTETASPYEGAIMLTLEGDVERLPSLGSQCRAVINADQRASASAHHTATHMLHAALIETLPEESIAQAGSLVGPGRLRFDFTCSRQLTTQELQQLEDSINAEALKNTTVQIAEMSITEAEERNAKALFGEKYGEVVRVVDIAGFSTELCGGTHVAEIGQLYPFKLISQSSVAVGTRRIEAVVGHTAVKLALENTRILGRLGQTLTVGAEAVEARVEDLISKNAALKTQNKQLQNLLAAEPRVWKQGTLESEALGAIQLYHVPLNLANVPVLRKAGQNLLKQQEEADSVIIFYCSHTGILLSFSNRTEASAGDIVKQLTSGWPLAGGKGGGGPQVAQGSLPVVKNGNTAASFDALQAVLI